MADTQGNHNGKQRTGLKRKRSTDIRAIRPRDGALASGEIRAPDASRDGRSPAPTPEMTTPAVVDLSHIDLRLTNIRGLDSVVFQIVQRKMFQHFQKASAGICDRTDKTARNLNQRLLGVAGKIDKAESFGMLKHIHELDGKDLLKDTRKRVAKDRDNCINFFNGMTGGRYQAAFENGTVDPLIEDVERLKRSTKWCADLALDLEGIYQEHLDEIFIT